LLVIKPCLHKDVWQERIVHLHQNAGGAALARSQFAARLLVLSGSPIRRGSDAFFCSTMQKYLTDGGLDREDV
jgi:hypothetical protein